MMIRKPSYQYILNQTIEVQSSINLSSPQHLAFQPLSRTAINFDFKPPSYPYKNGTLTKKGFDGSEVKLNETKHFRNTYDRAEHTRASYNDQLDNSFKSVSPNLALTKKDSKNTLTSTWRSSWKEPKLQESQNNKSQYTLKNDTEKNRRILQKPSQQKDFKALHQSKSSTRLGADPKPKYGGKQNDLLRETIIGRMQNNANLNDYWINPTEKIEFKTLSTNINLSKALSKERSISPIRLQQQPVFVDQKFMPLKFKRKQVSEQEQKQNYQPSKSPLKKQMSTTFLKTEKSFKSQLNIQPSTPKLKVKKTLLSDFTIGKKLGQGRFGVVWIAIHKQTGAIFALKKLSKSNIKGNLMIDQFILEVKTQSFMDSPYIVKIFGIFDDFQNIYLLLEYLEGGTLYSQFKKKGKLTEQDVSQKSAMLCEAVRCLHEKGIAHRDIKPQNVIITNGVCKLGDFGWATFCDERRMTYCGTTDYVAPEIVEGLQYDMSVDLWCIGVLIYELLAGKAPFYHISRQQTFRKIKNVDQSAIIYPQFFSSDVVSLIGSLIKKKPQQRMKMQQALKHSFITKYQF